MKMRFKSLLAIATVFAFVSSSAFAAKGGKKKKDAEPDHKGGMMEEGSKDPAETEPADEGGAFVPGRKYKPAAEDGEEGAEGDVSAEESSEARPRKKGEKEPEPEKKPAPKARKTVGFFVEGLLGFGKAPEPGPNTPTTGSATSIGFLVGGHYDITPELRIMARVPWTTATVKGFGADDNKDRSANALGMPEIAARYRLTDPGASEWAVRLGLGIPVAQGNPDVTNNRDSSGLEQARVQRMADAANGWHDPELYAPKRFAISPALLFSDRMDKLRVGAELKAVFMPKTGGVISQPTAAGGGTYSLNSMATTVLLGGSAGYEVFTRTFLALAAWATYTPSPQVEFTSSATKPTPLQFVLEPKILAQFGHFVPAVGFLVPLGGQLGGNVNGLRLHVDAVF